MTQKTFDITNDDLMQYAEDVATAKRPAYTIGSLDVLANFKATAQRTGTTPLQAWLVFFLKHVDSITAYARDVNAIQAEPMKSRFADAINYLQLGWGLVVEQELNLTAEIAEKAKEGTPELEGLEGAALLAMFIKLTLDESIRPTDPTRN